ncbi:SDR family NAD(P)-dependent oxidoreductase [Pelagibius sp. Alg239-R121]|uniref:SDR family oxidoreductase n=1 Tax=Pelagibius sp. Alg239-R121 TaxID=2993448 RepID=UPI0024A736E3|nr:SDR family NAD(P)-dependent oxidoreductase [Pelagibius sp. Alg239-R121]
MSFDLENHRIIVTGAARGIGLTIARRFTALGAQVSGWDLDCAPIVADPAFAHCTSVDVTNETSVEQAFNESLKALGSVTVMVANAGINGPTKAAWDYTLAEWNQVLAVDLTGVFLSTRAAVGHMRERDYGRLVIVASVAGKEGNPSACAYGAAKAGVIGYAKGLARELQPSNVTVNCVAPAITETDLFQEMDEAYIADKKSRIPMGRFCSQEEIADMVAWAASPRCSFTTGQVFDVTGGRATY